MRRYSYVLFTIAILGISARLPAATFFGPTPYLSAADSPFDLSGLGSTFWLEDFEDGELNTPGIAPIGVPFVRSPGPRTDSVDSDDGMVDGQGVEGHSLFSSGLIIEFTNPPRYYMDVALEFSPVDGRLPTAFGFVVTDCAPNSSMHILLLDDELRVLDQFYTLPLFEGALGDDSDTGGTSEDRFFGVFDSQGIHAVRITLLSRADPFSGIELDHLQYGTLVPEPSAALIALMSCCTLGLALQSRRKLAFCQESPNHET